jgi:uncharacterized protein
MVLISLFKDKSDFIDLCKKHKVKKLFAFGSAMTNRFDQSKSDIDLVVELDIIDPIEYGEALLALWDSLEEYFERKVDLLTEDSITNPYLKKSIETSKRLIYDGHSKEILV